MPAMAARSLWLTFCRMKMRPFPTSLPNASARLRSARATRPFSERKLEAASALLVSRRRRAQHLHNVAVDFRAGFPDCVEIGLADKAQFGIAERGDGSGARRAI